MFLLKRQIQNLQLCHLFCNDTKLYIISRSISFTIASEFKLFVSWNQCSKSSVNAFRTEVNAMASQSALNP